MKAVENAFRIINERSINMKRNVKSLLALGLILSTCAMAAPTVSAAEVTAPSVGNVMPRYSYINDTNCEITDYGDNTADFVANATGTANVTKISFSVEVQKKGLFGYSTVESFSKSVNRSNYTYTGSVIVDSSKTYRLKVTYTFYTSSGSETHTEYSDPTK